MQTASSGIFMPMQPVGLQTAEKRFVSGADRRYSGSSARVRK